ncbi:hypothetical protein MRY82_06550 [bacterium]|nr:hypothetical protein [bacterium]
MLKKTFFNTLLVLFLSTSFLKISTAKAEQPMMDCDKRVVSTIFDMQDLASSSKTCPMDHGGMKVALIINADLKQRGCCSHHKGVCGCAADGRKLCCDGTPSPSCRC